MGNIRVWLILVLASSLGLAPSGAHASNGTVGVGRAASFQAPGAAAAAPLTRDWSQALGRMLSSPAFRDAAKSRPALAAFTGFDPGNHLHQRSLARAVDALKALGHQDGKVFQGIAASDQGIEEFHAAVGMARESVRRSVREKAEAIRSDPGHPDSYGRAVELMRMRAAEMMYMDQEVVAMLDEAYETARRSAQPREGQTLAALGRLAKEAKSSRLMDALSIVERGGAASMEGLAGIEAVPGPGDGAKRARRAARAFRLAASREEAAALEDLMGQVSEFKRGVETLHGLMGQASALKRDVATLHGEIGQAGRELDEIGAGIQRLGEELKALEDQVPQVVRAVLEDMQDRLADLRGRRAKLSEIQSPAFAGPDGALLSYYARNDSPALAAQIRDLDEQIGRAETEIAEIEGPIRAKLAENRAKLNELKAMRRGLAEVQLRAAGPRVYPGVDMLPVDTGPSALETYLRSEGVDLGARIAELDSEIAAIEKENAGLKASLPRSWLRRLLDRWGEALARFWADVAKTYAKAGEYSIK